MSSDRHEPVLSAQRGRGAVSNPTNRFAKFHLERDPDCRESDGPAPRTEFFEDQTTTLINYNDSPDLGFSASINPYRGCEHGCIYCYARPTHEYLGFSSGLDFETKILVKPRASELLRKELSAARWKPQVLAMSGVTDPYQPIERALKLSRGCLEVLAEFRNPVGIVTKNHLVTRDIDVLAELSRWQCVAVFVSVTTLDRDLAAKMEPRTSLPQHRLEAITKLSEAGIPVGVFVAPVLPALTDHEMPNILKAAGKAGARFASYVILRLPHGLGPLFEEWIRTHFPNRVDKIFQRIREMRGGKLNDSNFGSRFRGEGIFAEQTAQLFRISCERAGIRGDRPPLSICSFRRPGTQQMELELPLL